MDNWFTIDEIDANTYIISEYRHWEETHCYLLNGNMRSLLIDTGLGFSNIYEEVLKLTDKPITAIATHIHWDHIGGHKYFPDFYAHADELDWLNGKFPLSIETIREMVVDRCDLPEGFCVNDYEFLISMDRVKRDGKGHSKKVPKVDVKSILDNGNPAITSFTKDDMKLFDPIKKKYIDIPHKVKMETKLDLDIRMKFTAKVALATGYYLFDDKFVKYSDCQSLRSIMMSDNLKESMKKASNIRNIRFYDPLLTGKECKADAFFQVYQLFVESNNASSVVWTFSEKSFIIFVAIYGKFVGMINFEAETDKFLKEDNFWLGHTLICQNGQLIRMSWRDAIIEMCEKTGLLDESIIDEAKKFKG